MEHTQHYINYCKRGLRRPKEVQMETNTQYDVLREWKFRVRLPDLDKLETVCVTGNKKELGFWKPNDVILLNREGDSNYWSKTIQISSSDILFRYCICIVTPNPRSVIVRKWETNIEPRKIQATQEISDAYDIFGEYGGMNKTDNGWLSAGKLYQFRIPENCIELKNNPVIKIKLTPFKCPLENLNSISSCEESKNVITEVANQNASDSKFKQQEEFGTVYDKNHYLIFNVTIPTNEVNVFNFQFYDGTNNLGFTNILISALVNSKGDVVVPIVSAITHLPIGTLKISYLIVKPLAEHNCDMSVSYANYWKESWKGLQVGHRGMGSSFKVKGDNLTRENTIEGFQKAGRCGADMVEFDVQLSSDLVPVVYHDFNLCLISKDKKSGDFPLMVQLPMQMLSRQQLDGMRIYHVAESKLGIFEFNEDTPKPFPLLANVFEEVDRFIGFNVEIKWPLTNIEGKSDLEHPFDLNVYLDKILEVVLSFGGDRKVVISCFDPDVCTSVRNKQNLYPTMFLTEGASIEIETNDSRCNSIPAAARFANNASLLGVVSNSKDLLKDKSLITLVRDSGLKHFCWGKENNNKDVINELKGLGMEGIIFDKMDVYSTKLTTESIFKKEN